ncbi:MAG: hypothetical protein SOW34_00695 [Oliverpabstia sp.]|nr:hypothetical protein [Oliverpabstia sp.]
MVDATWLWKFLSKIVGEPDARKLHVRILLFRIRNKKSGRAACPHPALHAANHLTNL